LPVIGVGFQTCGFVTVTPAPTNGCPAIPLPGTDFLCAPLLSEQTFGSPPVPAGGSASCEILISGIGPSTQLPSSVVFYRASRMLTPDGREVLDSAQLDDSLFLNVNLGVSTPVPAFGPGAMMVLALMLFAIAARRRRREFSQRR
jgi:MYXO-CTERM domain-containing protein